MDLGRPDMAYYLFTEAISKNKPIKVFNNGKMERDFTYIDDIVNCVKKLLKKILNQGSITKYTILVIIKQKT